MTVAKVGLNLFCRSLIRRWLVVTLGIAFLAPSSAAAGQPDIVILLTDQQRAKAMGVVDPAGFHTRHGPTGARRNAVHSRLLCHAAVFSSSSRLLDRPFSPSHRSYGKYRWRTRSFTCPHR